MRALLIFMIALFSQPAFAQAPSVNNQDEPLEVSAGQTLEWHRNDKQFIARGNVIAKQGTATLYADLLVADYRESEGSSMDIYKLTATGSVRMENNDGSTAYGDKGVYDVDSALVTLTGENLKIVSPERTITATDRMEYDTNKGMAKAIGNAKLVEGDDTITANTLTAYFAEGEDGQRALNRAEAHGNVVIITPEEKLTGDNGVYTAANNTAIVTGTVVITRGPNVLEGAKAEVDLTTNVSKITGGASSPAEDGRVRGVFFPNSDKSATEDTP